MHQANGISRTRSRTFPQMALAIILQLVPLTTASVFANTFCCWLKVCAFICGRCICRPSPGSATKRPFLLTCFLHASRWLYLRMATWPCSTVSTRPTTPVFTTKCHLCTRLREIVWSATFHDRCTMQQTRSRPKSLKWHQSKPRPLP